ncbi:MAG: copper chaperone PCu(A)C [Aliivibrio sp.]|uniref:copper chaperone PCu(A)C n=1 Tax=Aliivibrio sp. TaxID=1872443 RepID=UPI001A3A78D6|nr:copper chaperone PCu(A)C [Aliivibrio sp.]
MHNKLLSVITSAILVFSALVSTAQAENQNLAKQIEIENPVVMQLAQGAKGTGSKMTIHNNTDEDLIIESFSSELFKMTMLHSTKYESGKRVMFEIQSITIPAHKKLALTPNTHHLMLFNPLRKLVLGEFLTLKVTTNQGKFDIIAQVVPRRLK